MPGIRRPRFDVFGTWTGPGVVVALVFAGVAWAGNEEPSKGGHRAGRIYVTATLSSEGGILAVDPETGKSETILLRASHGVRVAPDGRRLVFSDRDRLVLVDLTRNAEPVRVFTEPGQAVWSPHGEQLLISLGKGKAGADEPSFETWRVNADGTGRQAVPIPGTDFLEDWSPDGAWVVTTSLRHRPQENRQVYLMRPDGTNPRRLTSEGDNLHARFAPDGRGIAYLHLEPKDKSLGVWVMDLEGKMRRKVYQVDGTHPEVCWSPDGTRLALSIFPLTETGGISREAGGCRIELMDLRGENRVVLPLPQTPHVGGPDWR